jgi:hypothetical protein
MARLDERPRLPPDPGVVLDRLVEQHDHAKERSSWLRGRVHGRGSASKKQRKILRRGVIASEAS